MMTAVAVFGVVGALLAVVYTLIGALWVEPKARPFVVCAPLLSAFAVFMGMLATGWNP